MTEPHEPKLRILLADDHKVIREGLRMLVAAQPDMEIVGEADDGRTAVAMATALRPDVVVMDVSMSDMNGVQATEALRASDPALRVLALTRHAEGGYLQELLRAGALGYVLKQSAADDLLHAIRAVAEGRMYLDPSIAQRALDLAGGRVQVGFTEKHLSRREEEVLRLVAWGLLTKEIAARLGISVKTVETHKANGMSKLEMKSRIDIVRYAVLHGWLSEF